MDTHLRRLRTAWLVAGGLLLTASAPAGAADVVAYGHAPDAVVDRDGVTHLVWNERGPLGSGTDTLRYCQIPPGGTACTKQQGFVPPASQASNEDFYGPHVMVTPFGEVILLSKRCCANTIAGRPSPNVVYVSDDGGETFGPPGAVGTVASASGFSPGPALFDGADRRVVTLAAYNGVDLQAAPLGGWTTARATLDTGLSSAGSVVQHGRNHFTAAWTDKSPNAVVRTYRCTLDPCPLGHVHDPANWSPPASVPQAQATRLASGPAGTFLLYRSNAGATDRRYFLRRVDGTAFGPPQAVGVAGTEVNDVMQDTDGVVHTLLRADDESIVYRVTRDGGATWGPLERLARVQSTTTTTLTRGLRIAARRTDAGFVGSAFWVLDDSRLNPPISRAALPDPLAAAPPPPPPPPPAPPAPAAPEPPAACRLLTFAAVDVIADGCLRAEGDTRVATGGVRINGLRLELGSGRLRLNPKARTISSGGATVTVKVGDTVLWRAAIDWTLPRGSVATVGAFRAGGDTLLGFPLKGSVGLRLRGGGAEVAVQLGLPSLLGGVTGALTVRADNVAGVHLRDLHVKVGSALLGPLELRDLAFDYDADTASWAGAATVALPPQPPGPSVSGEVRFSRGQLERLAGEVTLPGAGLPMDPAGATYLRRIRFSLETKPALRLKGGITVTAGPTVAGTSLMAIDGDLTLTLGEPVVVRADGTVRFLGLALAQAFFELRTSGYIALGGRLEYEALGFRARASFDGAMSGTSFTLSAAGEVCLGTLGCAGGEVLLSDAGFMGCVELLGFRVGAGYRWGEGLELVGKGCDVAEYRTVARAAQAGAVAFAPGRRAGIVAVRGTDTAPDATLVGPAGERVTAAPGGVVRTPSAVVFQAGAVTYFVLRAPRGGVWRVEPGTVPVTAVRAADGLDEARITARVDRARGRTRVLRYRVARRPGQVVTFAETGPGVSRRIGRAVRGGRGQVRFTPGDGPGGRRRIVATVTSYGRPRERRVVARYRAPRPARAATPRPRARRLGGRVLVTWPTARGAARYEVRATFADGRRVVVRQRGRRFPLPAVPRGRRATVTVASLTAQGARSRPKTLTIRAARRA